MIEWTNRFFAQGRESFMKKRILSMLLTVCLLMGLLLPGIPVQAASDSVDYSMIDARNLKGAEITDVGTGGVINWTKQQYDDGKLNWYILEYYNNRSDGQTRITSNYGMRMGCNVDSWIAFVIEAPGSGDYTLQMTHSEWTYGAELGVAFVMPMSSSVTKESITKTVHEGAALGSVDFYNANSPDPLNNKTTTLGTYSFKAGEEYVVVLYASEGYDVTGGAAYMIFSKITAVKGISSAATEPEINPVDLGPMVTEFGMRSQIALHEINGYDYYFLPIKGGDMHIYNLDYYCDGDSKTNPFVDTVSTGITNAWGCSAGEDGKIYVTGDAKYVFRYDPITKKSDKLTFASSYVCGFDVGADAAGNIYIGLNKANAGVAYYEKATGTFHIYDGLDPEGVADDCSAVAWDSNYIYAYVCGTTSQHIVKVDKATGDVVKHKDVSAKVGDTGHLIGMNVVDGVLFAGSSSVKNMIAIDVNTWEYVDIGVTYGIKGNVSEERDGKAYFIGSDRQIYVYNIATRKAAKLGIGTSMTLATSVECLMTLDVNKDGKDEDVIVTARPANNGCPIVYGITTKKVYEWGDMINTASGAYVNVQDVYASNDGSKKIFVGAYVSDNCAAYDIKNETYANYVTAGQTDSQIMYKGVLYAGNYSSCTLAQINVNDGTYKSLHTLSSYGQKRIHCLAAGGDKIFFSTVPDGYALGGYLAWYDVKTGGKYSVKVSDLNAALKDQVILSMTYSGGYLYCGTTVRGGGESSPSRLTSNIFVFDVASKKVVAIQEIAYPYVQSLDADSSGTVWGVISKTLFTVSYKNGSLSFTQKFTKNTGALLSDKDRRAASTSTDAYHGKQICFSGDNVYVVLIDSGLWKISKSGTGTLISGEITRSQYTLGEDGNIYYGSEKNLKMLPLNVTSSDKTAAASVNTKLDSLLKMKASDIASAVVAAETAYNKLTNVQKSLVDQAKLNMALRRYMEILINGLPKTIAMSHASQIESVLARYEALPLCQQPRVRNKSTLESAVSQLQKLQSAAEAEKQLANAIAKIDALPSADKLTLNHKDAVTAARKAYDALGVSQKNQVKNYSKLTAAETKIKELEKTADQNAAMNVVKLINALPSNLTKNDQSKVDAARQAYNALTAAQKTYVSNYGSLVTAEMTMIKLTGTASGSADVDAVISLISQIPNVITEENKNAVIAARAAYDTLTAEKQAKVSNYQLLVDAEAKMAALGTPGGDVGEIQPGGTEPTQPGSTPTGEGEKKPGNKRNTSWLTTLIIVGASVVTLGVAACVVLVVVEQKKSKKKPATPETPEEQIPEEPIEETAATEE